MLVRLGWLSLAVHFFILSFSLRVRLPGVEANRPLFEKVYGTVAEIRRLRVVAQSLAQEVAESGEDPVESTQEGPQQGDSDGL